MKPSSERLLDACAEAVLAVEPESLQILTANQAAGLLLGLPADELVGRMISEFEVGLQDLCFWDEVRAGHVQSYSSVESECRRFGGALLAVRKSVRLVESEGYYAVSMHDISARRQIEEETALANSLLMATLESTVDGILVTDLAGGVQHCNRQFCQQWQLPELMQLAGPASQVFEQILENLQDPQAMQGWLEHLFAEPLQDGRMECWLKDGRVFEVASLPQRYKERPIGRVFGFHDISKLKEAESQLIAARDAAQAANRAKSEFLSHMSHELRTPLNAILGFAQVLEGELAEPNRLLVEHISKAGRHLLDLINEVLDLSSIEAGKLHLDLETVDLAAIVDDAVSLLRPLAAGKPVSLVPQLGPRDEFRVTADARRLRQMLLNLVSNAIKYNRPNGRVEVAIKSAVPGYWRLMVTDTGVGIAEEEQKLLFQPFTRVGHKQAQIEGTGIGLAFTRKLARLMHGQIGFRSEPGIGSCFWVDLPAVVSRDTQQATGTGPLVLYIEDDALSQKLLATVLARRRPDLQLELAALGGDGLEIARQKKPALILLDQNLPDMSGAEIYRGLKSDFATENIPVFALSGNAAETDRQAALASGYRHYLTKPIQVEELLAAVSELLPQHDGPVPS